MKIKRYVDTDMRHVLRRVREEQGPDAVILSNRRVDDGIEVIAAIDYDQALMQQALGPAPRAEDYRRAADSDSGTGGNLAAATAADELPVPAPTSKNVADVVATQLQPVTAEHRESSGDLQRIDKLRGPSLKGMQTELSSLRDLVESQLSGLVWKENAKKAPLRTQVLRNLARLGIAPDVASIVVNRLEPVKDVQQAWRSPLNELAQLIPVHDDPLLREGGTVALIGPTGVGKTTTIAKIAARYAMQHGSEEIALICADAYRIGAKEHLTAFGNIIGVKVHSAGTSAELGELLDRLRSKRLILIDTEGMSQRDMDLSSRLAAYGGNEERVRFYLTLSAASQESGLDETVRSFSRVPLAGTIVTKIDEAGQLGCVISTLIRHDLRLSWLSNGQRIPDDLHASALKRLWLVNQAVDCMDASAPQIDEQLMAERYADVSVANA